MKLQFTAGLFWMLFLLSVNIQAQIEKTSQTTGDWASITWNPVGVPSPSNDVIINRRVTIPLGTTVEINNLDIAKDGILIVEGTLKVRGNLIMSHNTSNFQMGAAAYVLINGNFSASNQVEISVSSFLIIQGNFTKTGSSTQGELNVNSGNIYIFGTVDPNWTNFENCENYEGNTNAIENETCDYGTEQDYIDNYENFPPALQELRNCFTISTLSNQNLCESQEAIFSIASIPEVNYQWQVKPDTATTWNDVGTNAPSLTVPNLTSAMNGNSYRVVVKSNDSTATCKVSVSNTAVLTVKSSNFNIGTITGPTNVCAETSNISFSIPAVPNATAYSWTFPVGWSIINESNTNSIYVSAGTNALSGTISVTVTTECKNEQTTLNVSVIPLGKWTGEADTDWNNPANWSCNILPTLDTNVLIPQDVPTANYPVVSSETIAYAKDLNLENEASVTVLGQLSITGTALNFGVLDVINGSISFEGTNAQEIPTGTFADNRIENLQIKNTSGVISEGPIEITGILKVEEGIFNTGNALTLISSAEKTALIDGSGLGEVIGTVTMQRYLDVAFGYKYFSTPFQNTIVGDFEPFLPLSDPSNGFSHVYLYEENRTLNDTAFATGWQAYNEPNNTLNVGEGYAFNFGATTDEKLVELTGEVNNGTFSRNLENNNGEYTKGFHLVGNPYPSPIDWDAAPGWTKSNIDAGIYFFTASDTNQYTGTYTAYVNDISTADPRKDGRSSNIIPSMQGFFIKVSDPADGVSKVNGSLTINNKSRSLDFDQAFLKTREIEERSLLRLTAGFDGTANIDAMVVYFTPQSTTTYNKNQDAFKLMNTDKTVPSFYSITSDKKKLSINALPFPDFGKYEKVPLGIKALKSGKMTINLSQVQNLPQGMNIYLIDSDKRKGQNLKNKSSYTFTIKEGEYNNRFQLIFSEKEISDPAIAFNEMFSVDSRDFLKVKLNLEDGQKGELRVSTVTGQILEVKEGRGRELVEFRSITSSGIYFINLYVNDQRYSKKVLVNN
ncbi:MAG TPA: T9SS type A sorting domain-containing protein [Gillisia sp.]|nr:T9SS type A sorting domain-containing protein [Gillisia sp.]